MRFLGDLAEQTTGRAGFYGAMGVLGLSYAVYSYYTNGSSTSDMLKKTAALRKSQKGREYKITDDNFDVASIVSYQGSADTISVAGIDCNTPVFSQFIANLGLYNFRVLSIDTANINSATIQALCEELSKPECKINQFSLLGYELQDEDGLSIAKMLKEKQSLLSLEITLSQNENKALGAICKALKKNTSLLKLAIHPPLGDRKLSKAEVKALIGTLKKNHSLCNLWVPHFNCYIPAFLQTINHHPFISEMTLITSYGEDISNLFYNYKQCTTSKLSLFLSFSGGVIVTQSETVNKITTEWLEKKTLTTNEGRANCIKFAGAIKFSLLRESQEHLIPEFTLYFSCLKKTQECLWSYIGLTHYNKENQLDIPTEITRMILDFVSKLKQQDRYEEECLAIQKCYPMLAS